MRTIKFRAWDERVGRWYRSVNPPFEWSENGPIVKSSERWFFTVPNPAFKDGIILQQFTGLLDKNGKEIYEGDVVKVSNEADEVDGNLEVRWSEAYGQPGFSLYGKDASGDELYDVPFYKNIEIIGNIYQNPDLLTK